MSDGPIPYGIKAPGFDPTAGFRRELQKVEARRAQKESRALEMASMIEMADQSTMFGGDYSIANQWAEHLTENLDKYASSTEGMIKFQQQAQRLTKFIDGAEAYKKENFGSVKDGPQAGTYMGKNYRYALGDAYQWDGDLIDERANESYDMMYLGLNQKPEVASEFVDGSPVGIDEYVQSRPQNPFMPELKEGKILMGSTWYAEKGPNKAHETATEAYEYSLAMTKTDPKLERQAARFYQMEQNQKGQKLTVEDILNDEAHMDPARKMWAEDAEKSWINFREQKKTDDRTAKQKNQALDYQALIESIVPTSEIVAELPSMMTGEVAQFQEDKITFSPIAMTDKMDITPFLPESLKNVTIDNPNYDPATSSFDEKTITTPREVARTPGNIALTKEGQIILSGLGNIDDQSIGDIVIDPTTADGRIAMGKLSGMFREAYGVSFNQFLQAINAGFEVPETVVSGGDPLNLGL